MWSISIRAKRSPETVFMTIFIHQPLDFNFWWHCLIPSWTETSKQNHSVLIVPYSSWFRFKVESMVTLKGSLNIILNIFSILLNKWTFLSIPSLLIYQLIYFFMQNKVLNFLIFSKILMKISSWLMTIDKIHPYSVKFAQTTGKKGVLPILSIFYRCVLRRVSKLMLWSQRLIGWCPKSGNLIEWQYR